MCARYENFVVHLRTSRALSEHFQAGDVTLLTLLALTRWIHFSKCSFAYGTVHWDVNLHLNRWSPSAHVCKVREFRGTSAHFQSTFRAFSSRWRYSVNSFSSHTMNTLLQVFFCIWNCSLGCKLAFEQGISFCACVQGTRISWYICALPEHFQSLFKQVTLLC